jgi:hypothetical protein
LIAAFFFVLAGLGPAIHEPGERRGSPGQARGRRAGAFSDKPQTRYVRNEAKTWL